MTCQQNPGEIDSLKHQTPGAMSKSPQRPRAEEDFWAAKAPEDLSRSRLWEGEGSKDEFLSFSQWSSTFSSQYIYIYMVEGF